MTNSKEDSELRKELWRVFDGLTDKDDGRGTVNYFFDDLIPYIQGIYITKEESDRRVLEQFNKSVELMKEILMENFHYHIMCGEIKDPTGKIDVNKALVEYQELEPERRKFADYIESLRELLKGDKDE